MWEVSTLNSPCLSYDVGTCSEPGLVLGLPRARGQNPMGGAQAEGLTVRECGQPMHWGGEAGMAFRGGGGL